MRSERRWQSFLHPDSPTPSVCCIRMWRRYTAGGRTVSAPVRTTRDGGSTTSSSPIALQTRSRMRKSWQMSWEAITVRWNWILIFNRKQLSELVWSDSCFDLCKNIFYLIFGASVQRLEMVYFLVLSNSFQLMLFRIVDAVFFTCGAMIIASMALIRSGSTAKWTGAVRGIGTEICKTEKCETE